MKDDAKVRLYLIRNPEHFEKLISQVHPQSQVENYIKTDILKYINSWALNCELWNNSSDLVDHLINIRNDKDFDFCDNDCRYNSVDVRLFFNERNWYYDFRSYGDFNLAINAGYFIADLYDKRSITLLTIRYLGSYPNKSYKGILNTIEDKTVQSETSNYWDCILYLRELDFNFRNEVELLYNYLSKLPKWQKDTIAIRLNSEQKKDFDNLFSYIEQREYDERARCEAMDKNNSIRYDWGDPFEGTPENSPSF